MRSARSPIPRSRSAVRFVSNSLAAFALAASALAVAPLSAQAPRSSNPAKAPAQSVKLSAVIAAFLVDSGVRTRGLPWTTGSELPVAWASAQPVASADQYAQQRGFTLERRGKFRGALGESPPQEMELTLFGTPAGLAQVSVTTPMQDVTREQIEQSLKADGVTLQPLKCSRETEGASYGNLLDAAKVPGKTASGLWWQWNCAHDGCTLGLILLYRKADAAAVECSSES